MNTTELVFIPSPGMGHLPPMIEMATRLVALDPSVSISVLVMRLSSDTKIDLYASSMSSALDPRVRIKFLPRRDDVVGDNALKSLLKLIESHKPDVMNEVGGLPRVSAFVVDMVGTAMMEVATSIGVPSYVFFPSGAAFLGLLFYLQELSDRHGEDLTKYKDSNDELDFPAFLNPLPATALPQVMFMKDMTYMFIDPPRKFREAKGLIVNTFPELEPVPMKYLSDHELPPVYTIGPIVTLNRVELEATSTRSTGTSTYGEIFKWLEDQPSSSVVFLCFGSIGSFSEDQVKEIAVALEKTGYRFLWSLRPPPHKANFRVPDDYATFDGILPEGFLEKTAGVGKVIGWAPQAEILSHPSVGGFVSHCGWNSILESVWFGVPIAAWPLYSEQQLNAFLVVVELGLGVEIKMDYKIDFDMGIGLTVVRAEEIEKSIRNLMKEDSEQRKKVKEMSEIGRKACKEGDGSYYLSLSRFIHDILG